MPPTAEDLLAHAGWLRRLAVSLVGPAAGAEDLVQETWLAALRHPPERDGPLRPWLGRVLRNLVKMRHRAGAVRNDKRPEIERLEEERAEIASAETVLDRFEAERLLARLVAELSEPYRATVLLRYFEGWSAADIARHQAVPAGTVRWRLKTALDRLRADLDRESKGDRRAWRLALLPLAASASPPPLPTGTAVQWIWAMTRLQKVSIALLVLCVLGVGGWFFLRPGNPTGPTKVGEVTAAPTGEPVQAATATPADRPGPARRDLTGGPAQKLVPARVEHDPSLARGAFSGQVRNFSTGTGVAGAQVTFAFEGASQSVTTDGEGQFHFEPAEAGNYVLAVVNAQGYLPFAPEWGTSPIALSAKPGLHIRDITIYLTPAVDYVGMVVDPDGKPVAGAEIRLVGVSAEQALVPLVDRFTSDAKGEFVFNAHDDALLEARKDGYDPGRARLARGAQISHKLVIALARLGSAPAGQGKQTITGRVLEPGGAPVKNAIVRAASSRYDDMTMEADARSGDDGRFALPGLDPVEYRLHASCPGCTAAEATVQAPGDVTLRLTPGGAISGRVVDAGGSPIASFTVVVSRKSSPLIEETVAQSTVIDAEGRFRVDGIAPGDYLVRATGSGYAPSEPVSAAVAAGDDPTEISIRVSKGGSIAGRVVERGSGQPLALARVSVESSLGIGSSAVPLIANTLTDDQGQFVLDGLPPGMRSVTAAAFGHHMQMRSGLHVDEGHVIAPLVFDLTPTKDGEEPTLELVGIGAVLAAQGEVLVLQTIIPNGGAALAGLTPGDAVLGIDGTPVVALGMDSAIQRIRGPENSVVVLSVKRQTGFVGPVPVRRVRLTY